MVWFQRSKGACGSCSVPLLWGEAEFWELVLRIFSGFSLTGTALVCLVEAYLSVFPPPVTVIIVTCCSETHCQPPNGSLGLLAVDETGTCLAGWRDGGNCVCDFVRCSSGGGGKRWTGPGGIPITGRWLLWPMGTGFSTQDLSGFLSHSPCSDSVVCFGWNQSVTFGGAFHTLKEEAECCQHHG